MQDLTNIYLILYAVNKKNMKYLLENTFYQFFKFLHKTKDNETSMNITILFLFILLLFNIGSLYSLTCYMFFNDIYITYLNFFIFLSAIFIFVFLIVYFIYKKRYLSIFDKISQETEKQKSRGGLIFLFYLFMTFFLLFLSIGIASEFQKLVK